MGYSGSLKEEHLNLKERLEKYVSGEIKYPDVKKVSAGFGIYATRDGSFMTRVRQVGGEFTVQKLQVLSDIMDENKVGFAHISTRDSIQLHEVPAENVYNIVRSCSENGMPFKGGGGDTYRNPLISPLSGISKDSIFDVRPHALKLDAYIKTYDKAFKFGRKFKVSFSGEADDRGHTAANDLGFLAKIQNGERGFKVYAGGGLGRNPSLGKLLFDFLPEKDCVKAVVAMVDLFYEHGERKNRSKARLRFLVEKLGFEQFQKLYMEYFDKTEVPGEYRVFEESGYEAILSGLMESSEKELESRDYIDWKKAAVVETKYEGVYSIRLFIKAGNLKSIDLKLLTEVLDQVGCPIIRLSLEQDIYIPLVHKSFLPELYRLLKQNLSAPGSAEINFENHVLTCIGAKLCTTGLLEAPLIGHDISVAIENLFKKYPEYKADLFAQLIDDIKVSGCGSSCGGGQIAAIGFEGAKKLIDGVLTDCVQVYSGGRVDREGKVLARTAPERFIPVSEVAVFVSRLVEDYILILKNGEKISFREYMQKI